MKQTLSLHCALLAAVVLAASAAWPAGAQTQTPITRPDTRLIRPPGDVQPQRPPALGDAAGALRPRLTLARFETPAPDPARPNTFPPGLPLRIYVESNRKDVQLGVAARTESSDSRVAIPQSGITILPGAGGRLDLTPPSLPDRAVRYRMKFFIGAEDAGQELVFVVDPALAVAGCPAPNMAPGLNIEPAQQPRQSHEYGLLFTISLPCAASRDTIVIVRTSQEGAGPAQQPARPPDSGPGTREGFMTILAGARRAQGYGLGGSSRGGPSFTSCFVATLGGASPVSEQKCVNSR